MRYVLYLLTLVVFTLKEIFALSLPGLSRRLLGYFSILFIAVCIDFIVRLRKSRYVFYPVGHLIAFLLGMLKLFPQFDVPKLLVALLSLALAIILFRKALLLRKDGYLRIGYALGAVGVISLVFGAQIIGFFIPAVDEVLRMVYGHPALYFIMIIVAAIPLFFKGMLEHFPHEKNLFLFLIFIALIPLLGLVF